MEVRSATTTPNAPPPAARKLPLTKNGKKRRRSKLAPRYLGAAISKDRALTGTSAADPNTESVALLRDVFTTSTCRCFILKSFSEANLHKSLKYGIWSSTYAHNMLLDQVFKSDLASVRPVLFFFSGIARMTSGVRTDAVFELWEKRKYEGFFHVEWLLVKDVPNHALTRIKMSNTPSKKSITSCRDCEEVLFDEASEFISIFTEYPHATSAWDDCAHFDALQTELEAKRGLEPADTEDASSYLRPL
ncbi:putative camphor resistance crcb protein [Globisporangium polare]